MAGPHAARGGPAPTPRRRRALPIVALIVVVVAAAGFGAFLLTGRGEHPPGSAFPGSAQTGAPAAGNGTPGVPQPSRPLTEQEIDAVCSGDTQVFRCDGGTPTPEQQCATYPDSCTLPPGQEAPSRAVQECRAILGADNPACDDLPEETGTG